MVLQHDLIPAPHGVAPRDRAVRKQRFLGRLTMWSVSVTCPPEVIASDLELWEPFRWPSIKMPSQNASLVCPAGKYLW